MGFYSGFKGLTVQNMQQKSVHSVNRNVTLGTVY